MLVEIQDTVGIWCRISSSKSKYINFHVIPALRTLLTLRVLQFDYVEHNLIARAPTESPGSALAVRGNRLWSPPASLGISSYNSVSNLQSIALT